MTENACEDSQSFRAWLSQRCEEDVSSVIHRLLQASPERKKPFQRLVKRLQELQASPVAFDLHHLDMIEKQQATLFYSWLLQVATSHISSDKTWRSKFPGVRNICLTNFPNFCWCAQELHEKYGFQEIENLRPELQRGCWMLALIPG